VGAAPSFNCNLKDCGRYLSSHTSHGINFCHMLHWKGLPSALPCQMTFNPNCKPSQQSAPCQSAIAYACAFLHGQRLRWTRDDPVPTTAKWECTSGSSTRVQLEDRRLSVIASASGAQQPPSNSDVHSALPQCFDSVTHFGV
jgi:hypothetical protein